MATAGDPLSALPDDLLHRIFSFLEMPDILRTTLLSRRWRHLWTSTPSLDFGSWDPPAINRALALYYSPTIQRFRAHFPFRDGFATHIDSWINFAVAHNVQVLDLNLSGERERTQIPNYLFSSQSIRVLKLSYCNLNLPSSIHLNSLKTLHLHQLKLSEEEIKILTSGCPILEDMALVECNIRSSLKICAPTSNLKVLWIHDNKDVWYFGFKTGVELFAPNALSLRISDNFRSYYTVKDLSSLVSASLDFERMLFGSYKKQLDQLVGLLVGVSHVKSLSLCSWCVQVLSIRVIEGNDPLPFSATHLELKTGLCKWGLLGMAYLLKSSLHLEDFTINISKEENFSKDTYYRINNITSKYIGYELDEREYWKLLELSLSCQFQQLKVIKINGFMGSKNFSIKECQGTVIDEFIEGRRNEVELVTFFLKNCNMLDKMIISTTKALDFSKSAMESELLLNLSERLLLLPRASPNAEIVFRM